MQLQNALGKKGAFAAKARRLSLDAGLFKAPPGG
jgi:hypothetical protein